MTDYKGHQGYSGHRGHAGQWSTVSRKTGQNTLKNKAPSSFVKTLPIYPKLDQIHDMIQKNRIVSIHANTGSGKSTLVPTMLVQRGARTVVTTPTVVSARNLCLFTAEHYPQISVGMGCGGKVTYDDRTQLVYCTAGHLWRMLMRLYEEKKPLPFDIMVMDEAHTVSKDYEVLKSMTKKSWSINSFRLLISSATVDTKVVNQEWSELCQPEILEIEVPHYPITETFHNQDFDPDKEDDLLKATTNYIVQQNKVQPAGHFLVFLPGSSSINKMYDMLYEENTLSNTEVYPCFSSMPEQEIQLAVNQQLPKGPHDKFRAIILATDILETSVTVPGVVLVVDTGFQKIMTSFNNGMASKLSTIPASGFSVKQRQGRTGRTNPGTVHRMYSRRFKSMMPFSYPMELQRIPIFDLVLEILHFGLHPNEVLPEVLTHKVKESIRYLQENKLLDNQLKLQDNALFVVTLPVSLQKALFLRDMVLEMKNVVHAQLATLMVATLETADGSSLFYMPRKSRDQSHDEFAQVLKQIRQDTWEPFMSGDDLSSQLLIMLKFMDDVCWNPQEEKVSQTKGQKGQSWRASRPRPLQFKQRITKWCTQYRMNSKKIQAAHRLYQRIWGIVAPKKLSNTDIYLKQYFCQIQDWKKDMTDTVQQVFLPSLQQIFKVNIFHQDFDNKWYPARDRSMFYRIHSTASVINSNNPPSHVMLALSRIHIEKTRMLGFICNLVPIYPVSQDDASVSSESSGLEDTYHDPDY